MNGYQMKRLYKKLKKNTNDNKENIKLITAIIKADMNENSKRVTNKNYDMYIKDNKFEYPDDMRNILEWLDAYYRNIFGNLELGDMDHDSLMNG